MKESTNETEKFSRKFWALWMFPLRCGKNTNDQNSKQQNNGFHFICRNRNIMRVMSPQIDLEVESCTGDFVSFLLLTNYPFIVPLTFFFPKLFGNKSSLEKKRYLWWKLFD